MAKRIKLAELPQKDGGISVAFVNTASARRSPIGSYADLLAWSKLCRLLSNADAERLARTAGERPLAAAAVARQALELRDCVRRILLALVDQQAPADADVDALNAAVGHAHMNRKLARVGDDYKWIWDDRGDDDLDRMLWPVAFSAAGILETARGFVRQCAGEDCDLLFVDRTAGSPRKWCDIKVCGHRVRARKHYYAKVKPRRDQRKLDPLTAPRPYRRRPR